MLNLLQEETLYKIKLQNFEGPLQMLYSLIMESKLDISTLSLAEVTNQYLAYLQAMQEFNIHIASEFFSVAAYLVYLKSKKFVPKKEEEKDSLDLVEKLKEYKKYHELSLWMQKRYEESEFFFTRPNVINPMQLEKVFCLDELEVGDLLFSLFRYKWSFIKRPIPLRKRKVNIEAKIKEIETLLLTKKTVSLKDLLKKDSSKSQHIAYFYAIIEMTYKQKVSINQEENYSNIYIEKKVLK